LVLAVSKVLIAPTISNLRNFETERAEMTKSRDQIDRSLDDLAILSENVWCISVSKLRWFGKTGMINTFETDSTSKSPEVQNEL